MKKYVIIVNDGLYNDYDIKKNVFNREELDSVFKEWSGGEDIVDSGGEVYNVDDLIEYGSIGEKVEIYNENMVERGDDFVSVGVVELNE
jgi:hypothetical protein